MRGTPRGARGAPGKAEAQGQVHAAALPSRVPAPHRAGVPWGLRCPRGQPAGSNWAQEPGLAQGWGGSARLAASLPPPRGRLLSPGRPVGGGPRPTSLGEGPSLWHLSDRGHPTAPSRERAGRSTVSSPLFLLEGSGLPSLTAAAQSLWGGVSTQRSPPGLLPSGLPGAGVCSAFLSTSGLTRCQTPAPAQGVRAHRPSRPVPSGCRVLGARASQLELRVSCPAAMSVGAASVPPAAPVAPPPGVGKGRPLGAVRTPPANWGTGSGRPVRPWLVRCSFPGRWRFAARRGRGPQTQGEEEPPGLPCWRPCFQNLPRDPLSWGLGCLGPGGGLVSIVLHFYTTFPLLSLLLTLSSPLHPP